MGLLRGEQILDFTNINRDCIKNEYVCAHIEIIDGAAVIETAQVYWTTMAGPLESKRTTLRCG